MAATSLASSSESESDERQLQVQEQKLPRWAQSVIGDSAFALKPPQQAEDIEDIFQNTLEKVQEEQVVQKAVFYGIAEDEEEESKQSQLDLEDDAAIGEQILLRQKHQQQRLGLGDDETSNRLEDVNRHSLSQEFFLKKKEFQ